ncbi:hypothetical protein [Mycobacterium sp.]|uniref:hypothetical protein n=1 Tax=Mycobacterium sp. TaxID=1785 RepID=UPI003D6C4C64
MVDYRITADERARFKRCRRQWDFASPHRRDLEPTGLVEPALPAALKDALAVYYYPGTWDWQHAVTQPLVHKALKRSLDDAGAAELLENADALLDCYDAWADSVDDFAPIKINLDVQAMVPNPDEPERGLLVHDGSPVFYRCLIDLVAADAADEYWVVCHQVVDEWQDLETLVRDEEAVAACWAFEQDYLGVQIVGTIHNELRIGGPLDFPPAGRKTKAGMMTRKVGQNEPSGGGRSIPQHQRVMARALRPEVTNRTEQRTAGVLRRTHIRRSRHEITAVGMLIAAEVADMTSWPTVYPTFGAHCRVCEFNAPCRAIIEGTDPQPMLAGNFRQHPLVRPKRKLGQSTLLGRGGVLPPS